MPELRLIKKSKSKKPIFIICFLIIFSWVYNQIMTVFFPDIKCETVISTNVEDSIHTKGYIFRKETVIEKDTNSSFIAVGELKSGQRTSKGGVIAIFYENEDDAFNNKKIKEIEDEIEKLRTLDISKASFDYGPDEISRHICNGIRSISSSANNLKFDEISEEKEKLLKFLNIRQIATRKIENFNERISALKKERDELLSCCKTKDKTLFRSPETGSFVDHIDGFENIFAFESIPFMKLEDLNSMKERQQNKKDVIGKIIHDLPWYICFKLNESELKRIEEDMSIEISIPIMTSQKIPAKIIAINKKNNDNENALVICSCDYMNEKLINARENDIIINIQNYNGIKIPKSALREKLVKKADGSEKNITGVYALKGNSITFREIIPIFYNENYAICKQNPDPETLITDNPIKIYDQVVVEGIDLCEGKIIK